MSLIVVANAKAIAIDLGLHLSNIASNAMPLFHIGGLLANLLSSMAAGAPLTLLPRFDVTNFIDHIFAK
jgi:acyl-CoA synthetase (AMP-forming)/AMP-acid ligase II